MSTENTSQPLPLLALCEWAIKGPYFVSHDNKDMDSDDYRAHVGSGLAVVDTGRDTDWPVARFCEWPTAQLIARCDPATMRVVYEALERLTEVHGNAVPGTYEDKLCILGRHALSLLDGTAKTEGQP